MSDVPLRLVLTVPSPVGLDEILVGRVSLVNDGSDPVTVNARFSLAEGDLGIMVSGVGGTLPAGWPWPVDSGARAVQLGPGEALETGVLLLCTPDSRPLFPQAGVYTLVATYAAGTADGSAAGSPGDPTLTSEPVVVTRSEPVTAAAREDRRALLDRDVIQSIAAAGTLGAARPALTQLTAHSPGPTALLAALAGGGEVKDVATHTADPVGAATAVTAVLLPGEERRTEVAARLNLGSHQRASAMLREQPAQRR